MPDRYDSWYAFFSHHVRAVAPPDFPKIVCLCGSTRFSDAFVKANRDETHAGNIVLSVGCYKHDECCKDKTSMEALDALHKRKIDLADEILVLNVGGYVGESTRSEIAHATKRGKPVRYLEPLTEPANA